MNPQISRQTEIYISTQLRLLLPDLNLQILAFSGGDQTGDAFDVEPPLAVVAVTESEKPIAQEPTYAVKGTLQWISHISEMKPQEHENIARQLSAALLLVPAGQQSFFTFHGIDISGETRSESNDSRSRATIISFSAGVSG